MTLLQQRDTARLLRRHALYDATRSRLRTALSELIPGNTVLVFGSLTHRGQFNDASDVDLAFEIQPEGIDTLQLMAELSEQLGRPVDIINMDECRFREKILRTGDRWTT